VEGDSVDLQGRIFQAVWEQERSDARGAEMRRSGRLLALAKQIQCPVTAIHGDYDPHPAAGVQEPLSEALPDFRFILLPHCGHKPWIERRARQEFYAFLKAELP
jgi:pimeloyl-ACP methyl ester carboxylesterase